MIYKNGIPIGQDIQSSQNSQVNKKDIQIVTKPQWRIEEWFGDQIDPEQMAKLKMYWDGLIQYNRKINLISDNTIKAADEIHFADSIIAFNGFKEVKNGDTVFDIGSGNGFPGLVFAILDPDTQYNLVDKDMRKVEFLKIMVSKLGLSNCDAIHTLVEDLPDESIHCAISRA